MQTVDGVWNTKLCVEQKVDLGFVGQVGLDSNSLCTLLCFGLDDISENKLNIRSLGVCLEGAGELNHKSGQAVERYKANRNKLTRPPNQPAAPVMRTTLLDEDMWPLGTVMSTKEAVDDVCGW